LQQTSIPKEKAQRGSLKKAAPAGGQCSSLSFTLTQNPRNVWPNQPNGRALKLLFIRYNQTVFLFNGCFWNVVSNGT
jgi:hypothetical protein